MTGSWFIPLVQVYGSTLFSGLFPNMSYHGPRDNGEGRVSTEPERTAPPPVSDLPSVPIPQSLRVAWFLNRSTTTTENETPEITAPPPSHSIIQLLRRTPRPRSRSPPPSIDRSATREEPDRESPPLTPASRRQPLFRPGTFGLTAPIQQSTMAIEPAIIAALEVTPRHLIRAHVNLMLTHHCPLPTLSVIDDPIEEDV